MKEKFGGYAHQPICRVCTKSHLTDFD